MINFLRHLFLPHPTNSHRPKILHHPSLAIVIVLLLGVVYLQPLVKNEYPEVLGASVNISTQELVDLTNKKRAERSLPPLVLDEKLSNAAAAKASYMLEKNFWAHVAPDGTTPWYFIKNSGYEYKYAGENLARGYDTAPEVIDAWMESPTHRENMLSPNYKDIGFAVLEGTLTGSDTILVVQNLGSKYIADEGVVPEIEESAAAPAVTDIKSVEGKSSAVGSGFSKDVASTVNQPLVDSKSTNRNLAIAVFAVFIMVLTIDAIFIERKKIVRVLSHNLDHIIFLSILLLAVIIIGGGAIL